MGYSGLCLATSSLKRTLSPLVTSINHNVFFPPTETSHNWSLKDPISCNLLHLACARSHLVCSLTHVYCFPSRLRGLISTQSTSELHQQRQAAWRSWFSQDSVRHAFPLVRSCPSLSFLLAILKPNMLFSLRAPSKAAPSLAMSACAFCEGMCVCVCRQKAAIRVGIDRKS